MGAQNDSRTSPTLLGRLRDLNDRRAWKEFVARYAPRIYGWCRKWGLQDADASDVTQVVLAKLAVAIQTFVYDPNRSFRGWLRTVTRNAWCDFLRSRPPDSPGLGDTRVQGWLETVEAATDLADELESEFRREQLEEAMARVRLRVQPRTWQVFELLALDGLSGKEVGRRLGMTVGAVFRARHRVQVLLREEVKKLEPPEAERPSESQPCPAVHPLTCFDNS